MYDVFFFLLLNHFSSGIVILPHKTSTIKVWFGFSISYFNWRNICKHFRI